MEISFFMILSFLLAICRILSMAREFVRMLLLRPLSLLSWEACLRFWQLRYRLWCLIWSFSSFFLSLGIKFRCPRVHRISLYRTPWVVLWGYWFFKEFPWLKRYRFLWGDYLRGRDYWASYAFWWVDKSSWTVFLVLSCWHTNWSSYWILYLCL